MELKNIQSDWKDFGGRNYIVRKLYQCFGLLGDRYGLVPCPYGGPFLKNRLRPSTFFDFIANNGEKAVSRDIQCEDNIYRIFWCAGGKIGILTILGTVRVHRISGELICTMSIPVESDVIVSSPFYNGIAFLTENGNFYAFDFFLNKIHLINTITPQILSQISDQKQMTVSDVVCIDFIRGIQNECFICFVNGAVVSIKENQITYVKKLNFQPSVIKISPNGEFLAVTDGHKIIIFNSNQEVSQNKGKDMNSKEECLFLAKGNIDSYSFIDENRVACVIDGNLVLYGLPDVSCDLPFEGVSFVVQDIDHTRVYSNNGLYIISPVSGPLLGLFRNKRFQQIIDARKRFDNQDYSSMHALMENETDLPRLFQILLLSAQDVYDESSQEILMNCASFIMHTIDIFNNTLDKSKENKMKKEYTNALRNIRLLNTLRSPEFGFTTTSNCLNTISPAYIIEMSLEMNKFEFAYKACNLFEFNNTVVANCWANTMFYMYGDKALRTVIGKLEIMQNIDYSVVVQSAKASKLSAKSLSVLIDRIRLPKQKTNYLMNSLILASATSRSNEDYKDPLDYAVDSLDGDSIVRALFFKRAILNGEKFGNLLATNHVALATYINFKRYNGCLEIRKVPGINAARIMEIFIVDELPPWHFGVVPQQLFAIARLIDKKSIYSKAVRRHAKALLDIEDRKSQKKKTNQDGEEMIPYDPKKTPREIVIDAIKNQDGEFAKKIAKQYHVSPRKFTYLQLQAFSETGRWQVIERMSETKHPLQPEEFAVFCLEKGMTDVALKFVKKMKPIQKQVSFLQEHDLNEEAERILQANKKGKK